MQDVMKKSDSVALEIQIVPMLAKDNCVIDYSFATSRFGEILLASSPQGLCYMAFVDDKNQAMGQFEKHFRGHKIQEKSTQTQQRVVSCLEKGITQAITLHIKGTDFQFRVWQALLQIPMGQLVSYSTIAQQIHQPKASRAVGTAIGKNTIAFFIPCHRVVQASKELGGYRWGIARKSAIIEWERNKMIAYS